MADQHMPVEEMDLFRSFVQIADAVWKIVTRWPDFAKNSVGSQLVRAADSIGANLVEGDGRYGTADSVRFFVIARASARETRYWLTRAKARNLIQASVADSLVDTLRTSTCALNGLIRYRRAFGAASQVRELRATYDDPLTSTD